MRRSEQPSGSTADATADAAVWHDIECGSYTADLGLWLELAAECRGPILELGAGTGRVAVRLARAGYAVCALDRDGALLDALAERAGGLEVTCVRADACAFSLDRAFALCLVPMQTVQLLGDRPGFLRCAHASLRPGGLLAVAVLGDGVEPFDAELEPDRAVHAGVLYESRPTALRLEPGEIVLERRRERTDANGASVQPDVIRLARLTSDELIREAGEAGFAASGARIIPPTDDRAGSIVVLLHRGPR